jgi:hypothetical protein
VVLVVAAVAGILSTRRSVQLASATAGVVTQLTYMFMEVGILGSW